MTTLNVTPMPTDRLLPVQVPSYAYQYPSLSRVQLASVKEGLFHPRLPSFRRMDMDTATNKLPDEHSRTSTTSGPEDFQRSTKSLFGPAKTRLSSREITETGRQIHRDNKIQDELKKTRAEWSSFLNRSPERFNIRLPEAPENKDLHFTGYAVRYMRPEITTSWRYTLRQEPCLDQYGQRPLPANIYARYRDTYPQYHRNISTEAWR